MKPRFALLAILSLFVGLFMCDTTYNWGIQKLCGEPDGERKLFIDSLNRTHAELLVVKQIPCYYDYLEVRCKTTISEKLLDSIDSSAQTFGWIEVLIYNPKGLLIRGETGSM